MERSLRWTNRALGRLDEIADYIAKNNPVRAKTFVTELRDKVSILKLHPLGKAQATQSAVSSDGLQILEPYRINQGVDMSQDPPARPSDEPGADQLLRELPVEIICELGRVKMSGRELLELEPGAVVPVARPLAGPIDLTIGGRVVARGELVDIEGDLGVRVTEVLD